MTYIRPSEIEVSRLIDQQRTGWYRTVIFLLCCAVMVIEGYDMQAMAYAAPALIKQWNLGREYFGPVFSASLVGYMVGAMLLTGFADRWGRKATIVGGAVIFGLFSLATAEAGSLTTLIVLRFCCGVGLGVSIPTTVALGAEYAPAHRRATTISALFVGYTGGAAAGGFIAAGLIPAFGWESVFWLGGAVPLVLAVLLLFALPESVRFLVLNGGAPHRIAAILRRLAPDAAIPSDARFTITEHSEPGVPVKQLFTEGRASITLLIWFAFVTSLISHYFLTSWLPTILTSGGVPIERAVIAGGLLQGGGAVGSLILGAFLDRRGAVSVAVAFLLAIPLVIVMGTVGYGAFLLLAIVFLVGICLIGGQVGLNAVAGSFYPTAMRSSGTGWALGIGRIGSILGPVLGGLLLSLQLSERTLFLLVSAPVLCCAAATFLLSRCVSAQRVEEDRRAASELMQVD